jgi:NTP pyrophosphatase (non-canonical NTP hydrolase)
MNINDYQKLCQRTKSTKLYTQDIDGSNQVSNTQNPTTDILHSMLGLASESGEFVDPFKRSLFYGKAIDHVNLDEEIGDFLWYIAIYAEARGTTIEEIAEKNINKLMVRYPDKFTEDNALNRNLEAEYKALKQ